MFRHYCLYYYHCQCTDGTYLFFSHKTSYKDHISGQSCLMHCKNVKSDCTKIEVFVAVTPLVSRQCSSEDFHGFTEIMQHCCQPTSLHWQF